MAETADAIIIGAGIMGAATAYHLARRNYGRIVVLERDGVCSGSTALASGGIRHQYANRIGVELTRRSIEVYEGFAAEFGVDPQFRQHGYLILQQTEEERRVYAESAAMQRSMGVDTRVLGPDEVRARWPYLRVDDLVSATYSPRDGFADPYLVTTAIAARARDLGAVIRTEHPVLGIERLQEAYLARALHYEKGITVPAIVDVGSGEVVTNDFAQITLDLSTEWAAHHRDGAPDLYPEPLRDEMDEVMQRVYTEVNNGVYRCGFAGDQDAYEQAYDRLFDALGWLEDRLTTRRYLVGDTITEADVRLFTTLVRFDAVYHGHFKCNRAKLTEMPALWGYARDLFQTRGFGETVDFDQIQAHYYVVQRDLNPSQIVPRGPDRSVWTTAHGRESLS